MSYISNRSPARAIGVLLGVLPKTAWEEQILRIKIGIDVVPVNYEELALDVRCRRGA